MLYCMYKFTLALDIELCIYCSKLYNVTIIVYFIALMKNIEKLPCQYVSALLLGFCVLSKDTLTCSLVGLGSEQLSIYIIDDCSTINGTDTKKNDSR